MGLGAFEVGGREGACPQFEHRVLTQDFLQRRFSLGQGIKGGSDLRGSTGGIGGLGVVGKKCGPIYGSRLPCR